MSKFNILILAILTLSTIAFRIRQDDGTDGTNGEGSGGLIPETPPLEVVSRDSVAQNDAPPPEPENPIPGVLGDDNNPALLEGSGCDPSAISFYECYFDWLDEQEY